MAKKRRVWPDEVKRSVVQEYLSGKKSAKELAIENGFPHDVGRVYRWRTELDEKAKGQQIEELQEQGYSHDQAKRIQDLEAEIVEYQKKLAEQILINDLLKKLRQQTPSASVKNASGLTEIIKLSNQKRKPRK